MRRWENTEVPGRGTKYCLVMDPEDGTHPIRTYGWTMEEVLDKVAKTAETAQQVINRQRSAQTAAATTRPAASAVTQQRVLQPLSADEQMQATADLSNPAKAPLAIKTLLRGAGVDVDGMKLREDARIAGNVAQEWERQHPDFPSDPRNQQLLMDRALYMAGNNLGQITSAILDQAYQHLLSHNMIFEAQSINEPTPQPNAPEGIPAPVVRPRGATSVRSNALRATTPIARQQPKYTRAEIDAMNSKQIGEKIKFEPGFAEWFNREFSATTT